MPLNFPLPISRIKTLAKSRSGSPAQSVSAFRACYQRFEECIEFADSHSSSPVLQAASNFVLDFDITAKRVMGSDTLRYRIFQMHFLKNHDRNACCVLLNITHWTFASEMLAIEETLGKAFTNAGLFPVAPYFTGSCSHLEKIAA